MVLRPRQAEVRPESPIEHLHLGLRIGGAVDPADPDKASPVDELLFDRLDPGGQFREREVIALDVEDVLGLGERMSKGVVELGQLVGR